MDNISTEQATKHINACFFFLFSLVSFLRLASLGVLFSRHSRFSRCSRCFAASLRSAEFGRAAIAALARAPPALRTRRRGRRRYIPRFRAENFQPNRFRAENFQPLAGFLGLLGLLDAASFGGHLAA